MSIIIILLSITARIFNENHLELQMSRQYMMRVIENIEETGSVQNRKHERIHPIRN